MSARQVVLPKGLESLFLLLKFRLQRAPGFLRKNLALCFFHCLLSGCKEPPVFLEKFRDFVFMPYSMTAKSPRFCCRKYSICWTAKSPRSDCKEPPVILDKFSKLLLDCKEPPVRLQRAPGYLRQIFKVTARLQRAPGFVA